MTTSSLTPVSGRTALGLTILRLVLAIVFIAHGSQKLFVFGHAGTAGAFAQMGVPLPAISSAVVAIVELLGGIALLLGAFTPVAAILLAIDMLGAIVFVHAKNGFFLPMGIEYPLTLLTANVAVALAGPGAFAVDNVLAAKRSVGTGAPVGSRA